MYESLINADIKLEFNGQAANSFKLKEIKPTNKKGEGGESIYICVVEWDKKTAGMTGTTDMPLGEQTLKALTESKQADCPGMPMLKYKI